MSDLSKIVARRLPAVKLETHPDPNLLTAFAEKSLDAAEQQSMLEHLALCADCREVLALSIPEQPAEIVAASVPQRAGWLSWPVLRWGAAAACVVVVGAAIGLHYQGSRSSYHSSAPASDVPMVQSRPQTIPRIAPQSSASASAAAEARAPRSAAPKSRAQSRSMDSALAKASPNLLTERTAAAAAPAATTSEPQMQASAETAETTQPIPGRTKDESNLPAANARMSLAGTVPSRQMMASAAMIARAASVPANAIPRWTLTSEGMLQRSLDAGKTWETILIASPGSFRALTANGFDIWVGGAKGALYHSIDAGQHWMLVQPAAAGEVLTADIIGIEFTDTLQGTITTDNSQTWVTTDAGLTWQKQ